jgi:hypothetical protein
VHLIVFSLLSLLGPLLCAGFALAFLAGLFVKRFRSYAVRLLLTSLGIGIIGALLLALSVEHAPTPRILFVLSARTFPFWFAMAGFVLASRLDRRALRAREAKPA